MKRWAAPFILTVAIGAACTSAQASDPLGFYVGGAVGRATVRADKIVFLDNGTPLPGIFGTPPFPIPTSFSKSDTGWKAFVGVRPISLIGAEVEYVDFGSRTASGGATMGFGASYSIHMSSKAEAAFGVLYAPIPLPFLDLYVKAGVARLKTSTSGSATVGCTLCLGPVAAGNYQRDLTGSRFGYGAGVQFKVGRFAIRGEYERIAASTGDPDLLSIGALWTF